MGHILSDFQTMFNPDSEMVGNAKETLEKDGEVKNVMPEEKY